MLSVGSQVSLVSTRLSNARNTCARGSLRPRLALAICAVFLILPGSAAYADDAVDLHCRSLRAAAEAKAQLLYAPTVQLRFTHQPNTGDLSEEQDLSNSGYRFRPTVSFATLDLVRASRLLESADAACAAARAAEPVADLLEQGVRYGQISALRAQIAFIEAQNERVDELLDGSRQRLERQIDTILEVDELVLRVLTLRRRLATARQELALLDVQDLDYELTPTSWDSIARYEEELIEYERVESSLRRLSAWQVNLQAGPVPGDEWDWYGSVLVSVDLGGIGQVSAERRYLATRADEIRGHDADLRVRLSQLHDALGAGIAELVAEISLIDEQLALIGRERTQMEERGGSGWQHRDAALELDAFLLEAERVYLRRLYELRNLTSFPRNGVEP